MKFKLMIRAMMPLILGGALALLAGCASLGRRAVEVIRPDFEFKGVEFVGMNTREVSLNFKVEMLNKMAVPIALEGIDYDIRIEGASLFTNVQKYPLQLPASGKGEIKIPVTLGYAALQQAWAKLKGKKEFNYDLSAGMILDVPIAGERRLPFKKSGSLPMVLPPKLAVKGLKLNGLNLPKADLALEVEVDNPNDFDWVVKGLRYALTVNQKPWADFISSAPITLKKQAISKVALPFKMDFGKLGLEAFQQILLKPDEVSYELSGRVDLESPLPELSEISIPLNSTGSMSLINALAPGGSPRVPGLTPPGIVP